MSAGVVHSTSLIVTGTKPIYFNATPGFTQIAQGSLIGRVLQGFPVPNGVLILFSVFVVPKIALLTVERTRGQIITVTPNGN